MLKSRSPMRRTAFARRPAAPPAPREREHCPVFPLQRVPAPAVPVFAPQPKRVYVRSQALIEAFRLLPCQFRGCGATVGSMACHSNWGVHGKGRGIKADDNRAASGCAACHHELDQGKRLTEAERQRWWWDAHCRSVNLLVLRGLWPRGVPVPETSAYPHEWTEPAVGDFRGPP